MVTLGVPGSEGWLRPLLQPTCKAAVGVESTFERKIYFSFITSLAAGGDGRSLNGVSPSRVRLLTLRSAFRWHPKGSEGNLIHPLTVLSWGY